MVKIDTYCLKGIRNALHFVCYLARLILKELCFAEPWISIVYSPYDISTMVEVLDVRMKRRHNKSQD